MKIVFFAHPLFLGSQSMPRFVNMLAEGMERRGHRVEVWSPEALFSNIPVKKLRKWFGYMDQYLVFPQSVKSKLRKKEKDVLYVVSDHALGPYVPLIAHLPHVIHCHDFLAQRSALGEIPENVTSASGQKYQAYIRRGYSRGRNFISVSEKTRTDLAAFLPAKPERSEMVYNGLNPSFKPASVEESRIMLGSKLNMDLTEGYILHVGGNQWYKNREGIVGIYDKWRKTYGTDLPLLLVGQPPSAALLQKYEQSAWKNDIHFLSAIDDQLVTVAYSGATVFLFPSIAEGFGWPIAEAMASGTLVVTTNEAPMLEVAGDAAFLIDRRPSKDMLQDQWTNGAARILNKAITLNETERAQAVQKGLINVSRFKLEDALDSIERIYKQVLNN
ncbi:Glycosyltransferase involved in cell wall bisynthesis [Pedobacter westerhofensis]|uniref:Glycosyltransferase involved in cell wall bisynthesis n=1 Tax=Pedobacter westerhofensis TaxID=425512 RepID=A0A521C5Q7_9SPHI|nr:glycosyltransferase family 1 protein [Pedobacter westerhofensis]SMO54748.1 Glycosyltransferase involved in cell wall bisynthesis [Pedobacter westerhofensis]